MNKKFTDYFKEVFHLLVENKFIFIPTLAIRFIPLIAFVTYALMISGSFSLFNINSVIASLFSGVSVIFGIFLSFALVILTYMFRSGTLYLEKRLTLGKNINWEIFWEGAKKYPIKLFVGELFLGIIGFALFIPLLLILFFVPSLSIIVSIIIGIVAFIAIIAINFWRQILVYDDLDIIAALRKSIAFVKMHIGPTIALIIIELILSYDFTGDNTNESSSQNSIINRIKPNVINGSSGFMNSFTKDYILPIATFSFFSILLALIHLVLEIFIETVLMDYYHHNHTSLSPEDFEKRELF